MTAINDVTGGRIVSRPATDAFRANWDLAFGSKATDNVYIEKNDGYTTIIVDYHDNMNCVLRLNEQQYKNLSDQIIEELLVPDSDLTAGV